MAPYWLLLAMPAFVSFVEKPLQDSFRGERTLFALLLIVVAVMIGLRYEVGGDWSSYLSAFNRAHFLNLEEVPDAGDPGYVLLNWVVSRMGGDIWLVNLVCGAIFAWGLARFTQVQPSPWLSLVVAVPYLIVVVAMGYTRQGVAIGLAMAGLAALVRSQNVVRFAFLVLLAATFHKSAVLLIPIAALTVARGRVWAVCWAVGATAVGYFVLLEDDVDRLVAGYIDANYQSDGAAIRIAMNAVPAALFIVFRRHFPVIRHEVLLWLFFSVLSLAFVPALFVLPSTAIDRLALYMIPLQLVVLARVPVAFARTQRTLQFLRLAVVLYAGIVLFTWLNFANHSQYWLPYRLYPL